MNQRFSFASGLVLALSLAAAPVLARQAAGQDKMPGIDKKPDPGKMSSTSTMDKMTAGMSAADKSEMRKMMGKMAAMPPAKRKKVMQKMSGMDKKPETGKMPGMDDKMGDSKMGGMGDKMRDKMGGMGKMGGPGKMSGMGDKMGDKMMSGMGMMDKNEMKMMMNKMMAMPPAARKKAMQKMSGDMPGDM